MRQLLCWLLLLLPATALRAQYSLRIVVSTAATRANENVYITGNFNDWKVADPAYMLKPFGKGRKAIVLKDLPAGQYEYKLTRGSWANVETDAKGGDVANRTIDLQADASVEIAVPGWKDDFPDKPKPNTASRNVVLMDSAFAIPQLGRRRAVYVYLPASYGQLKNKKYPVLYMTDGQNCFNLQRSSFGEWGVDEALDSLQRQMGRECIVVAVDHGDVLRIPEYNPYGKDKEGQKMAEFYAKTLKPYIDKTYRTIPDAKHTAILGSSMGGLFSHYTVHKYPDIFGTAGVFSPAYWIAPEFADEVANTKGVKLPNRFYLFAGGKERSAKNSVEADIKQMAKLMEARGTYDIRTSVDPLAEHSEKYWSREFPAFYRWWAAGW